MRHYHNVRNMLTTREFDAWVIRGSSRASLRYGAENVDYGKNLLMPE